MDFLPTKGIEYLMVIAYLAIFTVAWFAVRKSLFGVGSRETAKGLIAPWGALFAVPMSRWFHRGHMWAEREEGNVFRVGIDSFARLILGPPDRVTLPAAGEQIEQGEPALSLAVGDRALSMLSPVRGEVVDVNTNALTHPELIANDPFGEGWLFKVQVPNAKTAINNLMSGALAQNWMNDAASRLGAALVPQHGALQQDGGVPITGFGRHLEPEVWREVVTELLLAEVEEEEV